MSQPHTPSRAAAGILVSHVLRELDHEQTRRDIACGLDPFEIAEDREDELQEQRDRFCDHGPSRWAA